MKSHPKIYFIIAAFAALFAAVLAGCIIYINSHPTVTELLQIPYLKSSLEDTQFFDLTAEVGDVTYDLQKNEDFAAVLDPDSWEETEEKAEPGEPVVTLHFGPAIHYTFYKDGYVYALYSEELRSAFVPIKKDTQYQVPAKLPQALLEYVLQNGGRSAEDSAPVLSAEECAERLKPVLEPSSSIEILSQELITWAQYAERYGSDAASDYPDDLVWVLKIGYQDGSGNDIVELVCADAAMGAPLEIRAWSDME